MSATISYIRENQLRKLKSSIEENLAVYRSGTPDWPAFLEDENFLRTSSIQMDEDMVARVRMPEEGDTRDVENCVIVYESLKNLTLQQASDERVWALLTHFGLWEYVQRRWPLDGIESEAAAIRSVRNHYFVSGVRGLFRDNGVSRLWWMGWIASRCPHFSMEQTLQILLHQSDVRANLLERSSFGMSAEIFSAVIKRLGESYEGDKALFERRVFREFMKRLNRRGGKVALNALEAGQLDGLIGDTLDGIQTA